MSPKALVSRVAGTNCDNETRDALQRAGAEVDVLHFNQLAKAPERLFEYDLLAIPGGFSYGDDIGSGVVFAHQLRSVLRDQIGRFLDNGGLLIGICNGFQVLLKAGLLTAADGHFEERPRATLTWNAHARYEDRWVRMQAKAGSTPWVADDWQIECPIRHAEGRFVTRDEATLREIEEAGQVVFRYTDADWQPSQEFPHNPNGSANAIAGIASRSGQVLGLMPHPECHIYHWQHPSWTRRESQPEQGDGLQIFQAGVAAAGLKSVAS